MKGYFRDRAHSPNSQVLVNLAEHDQYELFCVGHFHGFLVKSFPVARPFSGLSPPAYNTPFGNCSPGGATPFPRRPPLWPRKAFPRTRRGPKHIPRIQPKGMKSGAACIVRGSGTGFDTDWTKEQSIQSTEHSAKRPSMRGSRTFRVTAVAGDGRSPGRALTIRTTVLAVLGGRAIAARVRALFQFFFGHIAPFASVSVSHTSRDTQRSP